jgi:hypothetical protein
LEAGDEVEFKAGNKEDLYEWVSQTLQQLNYRKLKRSGRGLVRRYVSKMTGLSRAQATRLLGMYLRGEKVQPKQYRRRRFPQRYTREDAELLASVDEAHDTIGGPATRKILQPARYDFKDAKYTRLAELSVAQLYRLRKSRAYRERLTPYQPTRPTKVSIGERRRPEPHGQPGYLRVDTIPGLVTPDSQPRGKVHRHGVVCDSPGAFRIGLTDFQSIRCDGRWISETATPRIGEKREFCS